MDFKLKTDTFLNSLGEIRNNYHEPIAVSNKSIILCRNLLYNFKKQIIENGFKTEHEEIQFFKRVKQIPLTQLIYYTEIRSFEIQFPKANKDSQKKHITHKLKKLNRFFLYHLDFGHYIETKQSHFDVQYYTRGHLDNILVTSTKFYFQDPDFCTARDMLLSKFKAYKLLIKYLQSRLNKLTEPNNSQADLKWTANKTALTELIYALHCNRVINNGNSDLKEIADSLQNLFNFELGNFYKTFSEIKARKNSRTKFLDDLSTGLITHMNKMDE
ncbi:RteC domain-containing protein [Algibacter miyuki]|uniref:RteC domain-containing protein n=1 Tax=Algibacter miyuki TaxID=1306933 RepID=A0ABV5H0T9_9FLAO|nr:RteC domain-containing protein [Algibacter miyuki]MDN3664087.1 RteC domain-containing protein [Algibacter miyuki]